mmetsp:Transcript_11710/g.32961  ORF Transcript_11710/g.32961 Transcript_11710/m.32961 type:complete len:210 (+) Transcript_11710:481-1110(+)
MAPSIQGKVVHRGLPPRPAARDGLGGPLRCRSRIGRLRGAGHSRAERRRGHRRRRAPTGAVGDGQESWRASDRARDPDRRQGTVPHLGLPQGLQLHHKVRLRGARRDPARRAGWQPAPAIPDAARMRTPHGLPGLVRHPWRRRGTEARPLVPADWQCGLPARGSRCGGEDDGETTFGWHCGRHLRIVLFAQRWTDVRVFQSIQGPAPAC